MDKLSVKENLIALTGDTVIDFSVRVPVKIFKKTVSGLSKLLEEGKPDDSRNRKWLSDNIYFIDQICRSLIKRRRYLFNGALSYAKSLLKACGGEIDEGAVEALFEVFCRESRSDRELKSVSDSLLAALLLSIEEAAVNDKNDISILIVSLRKAAMIDCSPYILGFSELERKLRSDPSGIYPRMDRESQLEFIGELERRASKRKMKPEHLWDELGKSASDPYKALFEKSYSNLFFALFHSLSVLIWLAFAAFVWQDGSFAVWFLTLGPLYLCARLCAFELSSFFASVFVRPKPILKLKLDQCPPDLKTCVALTVMISGAGDCEKFFRRLEDTFLSQFPSSQRDPNVYFGLIADLAPAKEKNVPEDAQVKRFLKAGAERLCLKYGGGFFVYLRPRSFDEGENSFIGRERKRGAITDFTDFCINGEGEGAVLGDPSALKSAKLLVTLDADTVMGFHQIYKLIGAMAHPSNRPVIKPVKGSPVVTEGYGVLQPAVSYSLRSASKTPFSVLVSGAAGVEPYASASFDVFQDVFCEGMFCGKGIIDLEAYNAVCSQAFRDGIILSHDVVEGSRLRCGALRDVRFIDSFPSDTISWDSRKHRWIRGDVQSLIYSFKRVIDKNSIRRPNPVRAVHRWVLRQNVINDLKSAVSVFLILLGAVLPGRFAWRLAFAAVSYLLIPPVLSVSGAVVSGRILHLNTVYFSRVVNGVWMSLLWFLKEIVGMFSDALNSVDAAIRSVWRMTVSKKRLLEWKTFGALKQKSGILCYLKAGFFSLAVGSVLLVFSANRPSRLFGLLWAAQPFVFALICAPFIKNRTQKLSPRQRSLLYKYAVDALGYFKDSVSEQTNYLPPDNVSLSPCESQANVCSPTNAGLYLISLLGARDLNAIDNAGMYSSLEKAVSSLEKMEKYNGQFYNWYDLKDLSVLSSRYVSTVDSGNLYACFICLVRGLESLISEDHRFEELINRINSLANAMRFDFLYDYSRDLLYIGYNAEKGEPDPNHYDLYMSEARMTGFAAVAKGLIPSSHWSALGRPLVRIGRRIGPLSWTGTCFEYFMPTLLMPVIPDSFEDESLRFAFRAQKNYRCRTTGVFGVSESGYFAFDSEMNYQYKAFGAPFLRLKRDGGNELVVSPYSSFLMLRTAPLTCMNNLEKLKRSGLYGRYGFYEALDLSAARTGGSAIVKSYMAHHVGMSVISAVNVLKDDVFVKRFCSDENVRAALVLLEEKVPVDAAVGKTEKRSVSSEPDESRFTDQVKRKRHLRNDKQCRLYGSRGMGFVTTAGGQCQVAFRDKRSEILAFDPSTPDNLGIGIFIEVGGAVFSSRKKENPPGTVWSFYDCVSHCEIIIRYKRVLITVSFIPIITAEKSLGIRVKVKGISGPVRVKAQFRPVLTERKSFYAHPAFSRLFCEYSHYAKRALIVTRRAFGPGDNSYSGAFGFSGDDSEDLCCACGEPGDLEELMPFDDRVSCRALIYPGAVLTSRKHIHDRSGTHFDFALAFAADPRSAATSQTEALRIMKDRQSLRRAMRSAEAFMTSNVTNETEEFDEAVLRKWLFGDRVDNEPTNKGFRPEDLWNYGISGDRLIVCAEFDPQRADIIKACLERKKLHHLCSIDYDLVVPIRCEGYRRDDLDTFTSAVYHSRCAALLGASGGIFPVNDSGKTGEIFNVVGSKVFGQKVDAQRPLRLRISGDGFLSEISDGRFTQRGFEITSRSDKYPKWSHVLCSKTAGTIVTDRSLGFTWFSNSAMKRITAFSNDPFDGLGDEKLYISVDQSNYRDMCELSQSVLYGAGTAVYSGSFYQTEFRIRVCMHPTLNYKLIEIRLRSEREKTVNAAYVFRPEPGQLRHCCPKTVIKADGGVLKFKSAVSPEGSSDGFVFSAGDGAVGELGSAIDGRIVITRETSVNRKTDSIFYFVLGAGNSDKFLDRIRASVNKNVFELAEKHTFSLLWVDAENRMGDKLFWYAYQTVFARFFAKSGFYQCSGAFGFRDQLQDSLIFLNYKPSVTKIHLLRCACHQFPEGDVLHWWHNIGPGAHSGVRTRVSDDYLCFVYVLCEYLKSTSDRSVLNLNAPYLEGQKLTEKEKNRYEKFAFQRQRYPISHHALKAVELLISRSTGKHCLPLMLGGDWNDGMDLAGKDGGESVWLGMFALIVLTAYKNHIGNLPEGGKEFFERVSRGVRNSFNGHWFARAYLSDGKALGNDPTVSTECSIDLLPQAFAVFLIGRVQGFDDPAFISMCEKSVINAYGKLFDEKRQVVRLFALPFRDHRPDPGYIRSYSAGLRENGGQYTHAAVWYCLALKRMSRFSDDKKRFDDMFKTVLKALEPAEKLSRPYSLSVYKNEPYVLSGDVYYVPGKEGRGGWSWYTGAAGWMYALISEIENDEKPKDK